MNTYRALFAMALLIGCGGTTETSGAGASAGAGGTTSECPPPPGAMDCVDPCTGAMYGPSCVNGSWQCTGGVPDGGCLEAGDAAAEVATDTATGGWGCSRQTSPAGDETCTCADPVPPGDPIDPSACVADVSGEPYVCCELDSASGICSCVSSGYCDEGKVSSCEFAYACPAQEVSHSMKCDEVGMSCPGSGSDPYCWDWTCVCQDTGVFTCSPAVCS